MVKVCETLVSFVNMSLEYKSPPKKAICEMRKLLSLDPEEFYCGLENLFLQLCALFRKNPQAERGIKTILSFFGESDREECKGFQITLLKFYDLVLMGCESKDKTPRYACVWTLDHLQRMSFEIPPALTEKILRVNNCLIRDKCSNIRYHSVNIYLKQNQTAEILQAMNSESNKDLRKHMLKSLKSDKNIVKILNKKLKDADADIRLLSCKVLKETSDSKYCKDLLILATTDRDQRVRDIAQDTLKEFINTKGLTQLGKLFDLQKMSTKRQNEVLAGFDYVCSELTEIPVLSNTISSLITKLKNLSIEDLLILRFACESLKAKDENLLYSLMPPFEKLKITFEHPDFPWWYTQNLVKIGLCQDLGEENTRLLLLNSFKELCLDYPLYPEDFKESVLIQELYTKIAVKDFLATSIQDVFFTIVSGIKFLFKDNESEFCRILVEIINEVRDPLADSSMAEASLFSTKSELEFKLRNIQEEDSAIESELKKSWPKKKTQELTNKKQANEDEIKKIQEELKEIENQIEQRLQRTLILACEMLRFTKPGIIDAELSEIIKTLIYPSLKYQEPYIKVLAIECLGLYCLNNPQACTEYLYIFKVILQNGKVGVLETVALKSVLDFYMVYSFTDNAEKDFSVSGTYMLDLISEYLDCPNAHMKAIAVEGLCKLLVLCRSTRPDIVSKLLIMFFNTQSTDQVKQCLLVFFTHYPLVSNSNALALAEGFFLTISAISANLNKEILGIDTECLNLNKIFSFVFMYLDLEYLKQHSKFEPGQNLHFRLFYWICHEILKNPKVSQGKNYPKMVVQVNYLSFNTSESCVAYKLIAKVSRSIGDKASISALSKLAEGINKHIERLDRNCDEFIEKCEEEYESVVEKMENFIGKFQKTQNKETKIEMFLMDQPKKRKCLGAN